MNSEDYSQTDRHNLAKAALSNLEASKKDQEIERLQKSISNLQDRIKEERFGWIMVLLALVNYLLLKDVPNLLTPIIVFILELIALLVLARRSGIEYIEIMISRLIGSVMNKLEK